MKRFLAIIAATFLAVQGMATGAQAALVNAPVDSSEYITIGGFDWAWAGPCAPEAPSCGVIDMSFQGPLGWAVTTGSQITDIIASVGGLKSWVDLFAATDICASRFFSSLYSHCDYNDGYAGYIFGLAGDPGANTNEEVFVVRVSAVPVPASLPLLIGGVALLGLIGRAKRRV